MAALTLEPIKVDTEVADNFMKKYNNFVDWPLPGKYWHIEEYPDRKTEYVTGKDNKALHNVKKQNKIQAYEGRKLAMKIEENLIMFTQLEYLIRQTDSADVNNNIKLLSQHLQCCDALWNQDICETINICMNQNTPLYALGCVASALYVVNMNVNLVTTQKMAPLSTLFINLCAEIGLKIPLIFVNDIEEYKESLTGTIFAGDVVVFGCTGVVTESADIDSALDMFINSSKTAPWKLQRIYVQESVYDEVKGALAWKCTREQVASCADAFSTSGKIFVCDSLSSVGSGDAAYVVVEAYRTARELHALLAAQPGPYLSLWAADAAQAHETALASPAAVVWLNDYAAFDGPPRASLPVYEQIYPDVTLFIDPACTKNLHTLKSAWYKLPEKERVDVIVNALQDRYSNVPSDAERVCKLQDMALSKRNQSFVVVKGSRICFGLERPPVNDLTVVYVDSDKDLNVIIKNALNGGAVAYTLCQGFDEKYESTLESLENVGVPVTKLVKVEVEQKIKCPIIFDKLKVVRTNFGTIFAN